MKSACLLLLLLFNFIANAQEQRGELLKTACEQLDLALTKGDTSKLTLLMSEYFFIQQTNGLKETKKIFLKKLGLGLLKFNAIRQIETPEITYDEELAHVKRKLKISFISQERAFVLKYEAFELWSWDYDRKKWFIKYCLSKKVE